MSGVATTREELRHLPGRRRFPSTPVSIRPVYGFCVELPAGGGKKQQVPVNTQNLRRKVMAIPAPPVPRETWHGLSRPPGSGRALAGGYRGGCHGDPQKTKKLVLTSSPVPHPESQMQSSNFCGGGGLNKYPSCCGSFISSLLPFPFPFSLSLFFFY